MLLLFIYFYVYGLLCICLPMGLFGFVLCCFLSVLVLYGVLEVVSWYFLLVFLGFNFVRVIWHGHPF